MKKTLSILLIIFLTSGICSCGAKKTSSTEVSDKQKAELAEKSKETSSSENNVKQTQTVTENCEDNTLTKTTTYTPIDPTKPAIVKDEKGNVRDLNNASVTEQETIHKSNKNLTKNTNTVSDSKKSEIKEKDLDINQEGEKKFKADNSDRKQYEFNWWFLIVPVILFILVAFTYRKYKDKAKEIIKEIV